MGKSLAIIGCIFCIGLLGLGGYWWKANSRVAARRERVVKPTVAKVRVAMDARRFEAAYSMSQDLVQDESSGENLVLAGECATKVGRYQEAVDLYDQVPTSARQAVTARWAAGEVLFHVGDASGALNRLEAALKLDPSHVYSNQRMASLLNAFGRRFEASKHLAVVIQANQMQVDDLLLFGFSEKAFTADEEIQRFRAARPDDLLPSLGTVVSQNMAHQGKEALELVDELLKQYPDLVEAHAQRGLALEMVAPEQLAEWLIDLPEASEQHPTIWGVRARLLEEISVGAAVRCYCNALKLRSDYLPAHLELARLLKLSGREPLANRVAARANRIQRTNIAFEQIYTAKRYPGPMEEVAEMSLELGRYWEAAAWAAYARSLDAKLAWPVQVLTKLQGTLGFTAETPIRNDPDFAQLLDSIAAQSELKSWSEYASLIKGRALPSDVLSLSVDSIRIENVAQPSGLDFTFDNNLDGAEEGRKIFEITGGGIGVLDYDLDGWPDAYLAQAGALESEPSSRPSDQIFRNAAEQTGDFRFSNVTRAAHVAEHEFSQGVAVGDVDGDGLDDVYVGNLFSNSLLLNQGDGTFVDATGLLPEDRTWTCSAAIADLDGDGLPELYDANYVHGPDHLTRTCQVDGRPRGCPPLVFNPAQDRLLTAGDDGRWKAADVELPPSNSLGISVFRMQGDALPSIFVAVDQQANLFLRGSESLSSFQDEALVSGLAYDEAGSAQACMGIATGDVDNDGRVDLMVTNFVLEHNTFYAQRDGYFDDGSLRSRTMPLTKPMLGFGCQFADLQRDGNMDVLLINGHIDDHTHVDIPEKMPAQLFVGNGNLEFVAGPPEECGVFLGEPKLGRGLAVGDFNRDGLPDFVATYLESPTALLANRSTPQMSYISLRLIGTDSDRNAVGSVARLLQGEKLLATKQLTGGSGYQASNERSLLFAIPDEVSSNAAAMVTIEIQWVSGQVDRWQFLPNEREFTAVEGQGIYSTK